MHRAHVLFIALVASACVGPPPESCIQCGSECVDTRVDDHHCGACGVLCGLGKACSAGVCVASVASVTVVPSGGSLSVGATLQLTATVKDGNDNPLTGRTITWATSAPAVATISRSGEVTGLTPGTSTFTATAEGHAGTANVTVNPAPIASISVTAPSSSLGVGSTLQAQAEARDAQGAVIARPLTWASNVPSVATVNSAGLITAGSVGSAVISASAEGKSGTKTITVVGTPTLSISNLTPVSGASKLLVDTPAVITFSENIDAATVTASTISLTQGSTAVAANRVVTGRTVTLTPVALLTEFQTPYLLTITTGVKSSAGNRLAANVTASFTTIFWDPNYHYRLKTSFRPSDSLDTNPTSFEARVTTTGQGTLGQYWFFALIGGLSAFTVHSSVGTSSRALEGGDEPGAAFLTSSATLYSGMYWSAVPVGTAAPGAYYLRCQSHGAAKSLATPLVGSVPVPMMQPTANDSAQWWTFTRLGHR